MRHMTHDEQVKLRQLIAQRWGQPGYDDRTLAKELGIKWQVVRYNRGKVLKLNYYRHKRTYTKKNQPVIVSDVSFNSVLSIIDALKAKVLKLHQKIASKFTDSL